MERLDETLLIVKYYIFIEILTLGKQGTVGTNDCAVKDVQNLEDFRKEWLCVIRKAAR